VHYPEATDDRAPALSPLESALLGVERARTPMHIGTVGIFEGGPR
jgi:hypothetical protein